VEHTGTVGASPLAVFPHHDIEEGVARAHKTLRNVTGAWVEGQKVIVKDGKITGYRVNLKVTFILDD
jgi:flavin-binding protein dodecin